MCGYFHYEKFAFRILFSWNDLGTESLMALGIAVGNGK